MKQLNFKETFKETPVIHRAIVTSDDDRQLTQNAVRSPETDLRKARVMIEQHDLHVLTIQAVSCSIGCLFK